MRLQIFDENGNRIGTLTNYKDRAITESLDSGDKELSFLYQITGPMTDLLKEECYIRTKTDEFVLKSVDMGDNYNTYTASLNVEGLEAAVFVSGFESVEKTVEECLNTAFVGTGWKVKVSGVTKRRTIRETDSTSAWNILQKALTTYRCECSIDSLSKSVEIYERIGKDKGCYFMEGLNIKKPTKKSDTYDFYTRIYPIGKDGITPAAITGKDYIDNFQYSKKVKPFVWKDERYTDVESLVEDATAKLEELSRPHKEFAVEVKDLAKAKTSESNVYTDILSYEIGDTVTLISKTGRIREKQRIVKLVRYPESPEKNTAEISNASKTFAEIQQEEVDSLSDSIADEVENRKEEDSKTTVRLEKTEQSIEAEVSQRIAENLELATKIASTAHKISMTATGGEKSVGIVIQLYDENGNLIDTTSGAANIEVTGFVKFNDLANAGSTVINGANITTGTISCDRLNGGTIKGQKIILDEGWSLLKDTLGNDIYSLLASWQKGQSFAKWSSGNDWYGLQRFHSEVNLSGDINAPGIKNRSSSAAANVRCQSSNAGNGYLAIAATSSQRYKHDIADITDPKLDPHRLLRLYARQYKYNLDYLDPEDARYDEVVCGFVAEEVLKQYPVACEFNAYGMPENWDARYIIPPMLSLIQEQHEDIEQLKVDYINIQGELEILKSLILKMEDENMLRQQKTTNYSATLTADDGSGEEKAYVYFSATVQPNGEHTVSYVVKNKDLFKANKEEFEKGRKEFEVSVEEDL
nr:MAG TPA: tail protein [Caudoviricetes sp.]